MSDLSPGPWTIDHESWCLRDARGLKIASVAFARRTISHRLTNEERAANIAAMRSAPELIATLEAVEQLIRIALPKLNWGASALDADAIRLLNEVPGLVTAALAQAKEIRHE